MRIKTFLREVFTIFILPISFLIHYEYPLVLVDEPPAFGESIRKKSLRALGVRFKHAGLNANHALDRERYAAEKVNDLLGVALATL